MRIQKGIINSKDEHKAPGLITEFFKQNTMNSSVGILTRLWVGLINHGVDTRKVHTVQTCLGVLPASCQWDAGALSLAVKR
jgi:nitrate/nitrite transporter NarK